MTTLAQVVDFYNGQILGTNGQPAIFRFNSPLSQAEKNQVIAFFNSLTDPRVANETFPFDRPDLHSERLTAATNLFGVGTPAGLNGAIPASIANSPSSTASRTGRSASSRRSRASSRSWGSPTHRAPGP
ncbi:MAG: hypothetical protein GY711_12040 [bacterium]|nr:hypothetical protein [bacterium]